MFKGGGESTCYSSSQLVIHTDSLITKRTEHESTRSPKWKKGGWLCSTHYTATQGSLKFQPNWITLLGLITSSVLAALTFVHAHTVRKHRIGLHVVSRKFGVRNQMRANICSTGVDTKHTGKLECVSDLREDETSFNVSMLIMHEMPGPSLHI